MSLPQIIFSHANSFPASTYRVLFGHLRARLCSPGAGQTGARPAPTSAPSVVEARLTDIDPDALSPREALDALYALKKMQTGRSA